MTTVRRTSVTESYSGPAGAGRQGQRRVEPGFPSGHLRRLLRRRSGLHESDAGRRLLQEDVLARPSVLELPSDLDQGLQCHRRQDGQSILCGRQEPDDLGS